MPSFRVVNGTKYETAKLRRFVREALKARGAEDALIEIEFKQSRSPELRAWAWHEEGRILIRVPWRFTEVPDFKSLAQQLIHEIDHLLGLDHVDMEEWWDLDVPWAKDAAIAIFGLWVELPPD